MLFMIGSDADHLRVEDEATAINDPNTSDGVRLRLRICIAGVAATCPACGHQSSSARPPENSGHR